MWKNNLLQHVFEIKAGHMHKSNTVNMRVWHACVRACVSLNVLKDPRHMHSMNKENNMHATIHVEE